MMFGTDHLAGMYYELAHGNNFAELLPDVDPATGKRRRKEL